MSNKKGHSIPNEVKADIIRRVKEEGVSVSQAAKDHGLHESTIYNWLGTGASGAPSWSEFARLQKQNRELFEVVGELTVKLSAAQKKELSKKRNKSALARTMGVSRASLYYVSRQDKKDWALKVRLEEELQRHPAYGSRRLGQALSVSRPRAQRVMRIFGIKPYRRRGRKYRKPKASQAFPNLLFAIMPSYANHVWATDFTELIYRGKKVYASTVIDLFTRKIVGVHVAVRKGLALTMQTLANALFHHPRPVIFHSDNGSEYKARAFIDMLEDCGITISRSRPGCPWENGYQESFYDKFKVDLGDPSRFKTFGELIAEIYGTLWHYNHTRIHSALKMPPAVFAEKIAA